MGTVKAGGYGAALSAMFCGLLSMEGHVVGVQSSAAVAMRGVRREDPGKHEARRGAGLRGVEHELERELRPTVPRGWR